MKKKKISDGRIKSVEVSLTDWCRVAVVISRIETIATRFQGILKDIGISYSSGVVLETL